MEIKEKVGSFGRFGIYLGIETGDDANKRYKLQVERGEISQEECPF